MEISLKKLLPNKLLLFPKMLKNLLFLKKKIHMLKKLLIPKKKI